MTALRSIARLAFALLCAVLTAQAGVSVDESAVFAFDTRDNLAGLAAESAVFAFDTRLPDGLSGAAVSSSFAFDTRGVTAPPLLVAGILRTASGLPVAFKDFSAISEKLSPEQLVHELDTYFKAFDFIISQYKLEKIKTIGDAYMCASGLSDRISSAVNIVKTALEIQQYLYEMKAEKMHNGEPIFEARIGIHTGPVVAGVVGVNKFAYDIWGDTVNIAARMQEACEPGQINISADTYREIQYNFRCHYRGRVHAKNKGEIDMYYVGGVLQTA